MEGYERHTYGDAFADVYDEWYEGITNVDDTVRTIAELATAAGDGDVVELGCGTGRILAPLAAALPERRVVGIDASAAMLARLPHHHRAEVVLGDMVEALPAGPLAVAFATFNTFFNLESRERQQACFAAVAERLAPRGAFAIEAFVVDADEPSSAVEVRHMTATDVVLSVSRLDTARQRAEGHFIELRSDQPVRLRPWSISYASPAELDEMAQRCGLRLRDRWLDFSRAPSSSRANQHVSVYTR
jgi:trans-aconitate methyltransferase